MLSLSFCLLRGGDNGQVSAGTTRYDMGDIGRCPVNALAVDRDNLEIPGSLRGQFYQIFGLESVP
jgi:hypothetical protein